MIKCEIIHASLEAPPRYVAISYAWGDAGNTRKIELEGSLVPVGVSLYGALEALRQRVESVLVDERTQQVQLMTNKYSTAESVAIWLGPEADNSALAVDLLRVVADQAESPDKVSHLMSSRVGKPDMAAVVSLFERDYWRRLWVVQEIFNAKLITVHCGSTKLQWRVYQRASDTFSRHRADLDYYFRIGQGYSRRHTISPNQFQFSHSQVLVYQGPGSLPNLRSCMRLREGSLLEVLRACRWKLASDAKDKLYGILGDLPEEIRNEFRADYGPSVKDVYTGVVEYLLKTTECLDVICDAIHFPVHIGSANLPSYVPDWSHIPQTAAMGHKYNFSAAGVTKSKCRFLDERLNKLEISAIYLDTIDISGIAVGTLCTLADYLMAFLHWMALLLASLDNQTQEYSLKIQNDFCRTISLDQRLPHMPLNKKLRDYVNARVDIKFEDRRQFLQKHFGDMMMGRCFCITKEKRVGMGTGFMVTNDIVIMPLGCSTPVLLRQEGAHGEYRFVGDIYIHGYMRGKAIDQLTEGKREVRKYVLH
ncbi:heterokaryon incompatibility protein-domain-containing protein [Amylocarpus encephaloides]|uniref:Heterokaryon incompatibility protein-domain-containing protein n=1 Tax=Amylocarpus encephaloides TaxID=45428 RepID=A0A9P8C6W6_9HELO|nr:heterokaryon incompatibility protein-domain-containing protein [Amylocarpus encephaloides]